MCQTSQIFSESMESIASQDDITENGSITNALGINLCKESQGCFESSESVYIEHELVENEDEPDFCNIRIIKEEIQEEIEMLDQSYIITERELKSEEISDSSSTEVEPSDNESSDDDLGDVDLDDILKAERTEDDGSDEIIRQYEYHDVFGDSLRHQSSVQKSTSTPHLPPGLRIPRRPSPLFGFPQPVPPQIPKINGIEVRMREVILSNAEIEVYSDRVYGRWRVRNLSRLRQCWTPREDFEEDSEED